MSKQIETLEELQQLASRSDGCDCYIKLLGGLRSSKHITYDDKWWYIYNCIDDTETVCELKDLDKKTNIIEALKKNALFLDD